MRKTLCPKPAIFSSNPSDRKHGDGTLLSFDTPPPGCMIKNRYTGDVYTMDLQGLSYLQFQRRCTCV